MTESTALGRFAFAALVPALVLPPLAAVAAVLAGLAAPQQLHMGREGLAAFMTVIFMFVLLVSMTLNASVILRHPESWAVRSLPRPLSALLLVQFGITALWAAVFAVFPVFVLEGVIFGAPLAVLAIAIYVQASRRSRLLPPVGSVPHVGLSVGARVLGGAYLAAVVLAVTYAVVSLATGAEVRSTDYTLGGGGTLALFVLGIPWSLVLYFPGALLSLVLPGRAEATVVIVCVMLLATAVNVVLVSLLMWVPARRTALVNWFFRLKPPGG